MAGTFRGDCQIFVISDCWLRKSWINDLAKFDFILLWKNKVRLFLTSETLFFHPNIFYAFR